MTHFLWVEDFKASENKNAPPMMDNPADNIVSSTIDSVFGSILDKITLNDNCEDIYDVRDFLKENGIFLKLNLLEALEFIRNPDELAKIDFIVLDVDMPICRKEQEDVNDYLPNLIKEYESESELGRIAGYPIYIELVIELGFPKSHILFCSNHAKYFDELQSKFKNAKIKLPVSPNPEKAFLEKEDKAEINHWLDEAHRDYFVLRRGIIEGCRAISKNLTEKCLSFNGFIEPEKQVNLEDMRDYLSVLEKFLPLREPSDADKSVLYKLFIRTLTHEWEATEPKKIRGLAWIMKSTRNWITHNSTLFNALDEIMVAYLFMINMRLMFSFDEAVQPYEKILITLFKDDDLPLLDTFKNQASSKLFPLSKAYLELKNIALDERQEKSNNVQDGFYFNELANNLQQSNSSFRNDKILFSKLIYQMFWLTTSNPFISTGNRRNLLEIKFWDFNYAEKPYLFELARYIYSRSFS